MIDNNYKAIEDMVLKTAIFLKLQKDGFFKNSNFVYNTHIDDLRKGNMGTFYYDESKTKRAVVVVK
jgi:hypothetical protein